MSPIAGWPGDEISLVVWAFVGQAAGDQLGDEPETVIERFRENGGLERALGMTNLDGMDRRLLVAMAWAGIARVATARRNDALRACRAAGVSLRELGEATRLSHTAVGKIVAPKKTT